MKKAVRIKTLVMFVVFVLTLALAGFGSNGNSRGTVSSTSAQAAEKEVEISMYLIGAPSKDYDEILSEFNKKAKSDLNATLKVNWIGWGDYGTKYPLILASGEPIDLIYTSTWLNFYTLAQKGAFMALDKIGPQYAPKSFANEPKEGLKQATVNGHIYALPPNFIQYSEFGVIYRGDLAKKYGINRIKTFDDYGKYLDAIVRNEKGMDPAGMYATQTPIDRIYFDQQNLYPLSGDWAINSPFWIQFDDPSGKVINITKKADMPRFLAKMKSWSDKGYWPKSVLSNKDDKMLQEGKAASLLHNMGFWSTSASGHPEYDLKFADMHKNSFPTPMMQDGMAVPASAKNPERALMLLEKIRNDESYWSLLTYGLKDKDYTIEKDGRLKPLRPDVFTPENYCSWGFNDRTFHKELVSDPAELLPTRAAIIKSAKKNIYTTFNINIEPIKSEYAAILNVMQQYYVPLKLGYVDPVSGLATLKSKLKAAGVDKVQAELQKQVNAFRKANK